MITYVPVLLATLCRPVSPTHNILGMSIYVFIRSMKNQRWSGSLPFSTGRKWAPSDNIIILYTMATVRRGLDKRSNCLSKSVALLELRVSFRP